jgi:ubiquinone/menaquinone biosynthesis C-methylase UbiE
MNGPERYDRLVLPFVHPYTEALLRAVRVLPGATILDHGAGTGEVTLAVHRRWPEARVVALDPSGPMLERLRARVGEAPWLTIYQGQLQPGTELGPFDLCLSQLALMFVPDPATELATLRRITRPGGHLAISVLRDPASMVPFFAYWTAARQVLPQAIVLEGYPHHRFAEAAALQLMAEEAGWAEVRVAPIGAERVCGEATLWRWLSTTLPIQLTTGEAVDVTADPQITTAIRRALGTLVEPYRSGASYHLPTGVWLLTATVPSETSRDGTEARQVEQVATDRHKDLRREGDRL